MGESQSSKHTFSQQGNQKKQKRHFQTSMKKQSMVKINLDPVPKHENAYSRMRTELDMNSRSASMPNLIANEEVPHINIDSIEKIDNTYRSGNESMRSIHERSLTKTDRKLGIVEEIEKEEYDKLDEFLIGSDSDEGRPKSRQYTLEHMKKIVQRQRVQIEDLHVEIQELNKKMARKERYDFENPKELIEKILESIPEVTNLTTEFSNLLESVP